VSGKIRLTVEIWRIKVRLYLGSGLCALGIEVKLSQIPVIFFTVLSTRKESKRNHLTESNGQSLATSIGTEVSLYCCRAGLFGSKCDLPMQISPLGG
jgi:hypothetical protein